jgi:hypothetical protein
MRILPRRTRGPDRLLRDALQRVNAHTARAGGSPTDVQLLAQVSVSDDWPQIREYWTRRAGLTASWPTRVGPNELALNLWPIHPGSLQLTTGVGVKPQRRQPPKLLGTPALACFDPVQGRTSADEALARAVASWADDVLTHDEFRAGLRLAPPILEEWASKGRLVSRRVITFDLEWTLAGAEGVTWPTSA